MEFSFIPRFPLPPISTPPGVEREDARRTASTIPHHLKVIGRRHLGAAGPVAGGGASENGGSTFGAPRSPLGEKPPPTRSQSRGESSAANRRRKMEAKMFHPDPFPMRGDNFERVVKALEGHARSTYNVLHHYHLLTVPRRWDDRLELTQKNSFFFITKPEEWMESGAVGEFVAAIQTVPVLAVYLVRRLNILKYVAIATYNGRVAAFSIRALEKVCPWRDRVELLPPEVRSWLQDPDVAVVTSGEARTFKRPLHGIEVANQIDTERIYKIYQDKGVIKPAVLAERGDLSWQMAYAVGYHTCTSRQNTWLQLVGENKFKVKGRDWPEWRMPGWQPDSLWRLEEQEKYSLFFGAYGPHAFISRLLRHGLVYGGMEAVEPRVPLRDCFLIFLQGAMEETDLQAVNPLGLQSDSVITDRRDLKSPAVRLYNPKFAHLRTPLEKEEAKRARMAAFQQRDDSSLFPEPPTSTTEALGAPSPVGDRDAVGGEVEVNENPVELVEEVLEGEEEEEEEELELCAGEEELSLLDNNNNEGECPGDLPDGGKPSYKKDNRRSRRKGNNKKNNNDRSEADIQAALQKLSGSAAPDAASTSKDSGRKVTLLEEKVPIVPAPARLPLAHRLGPIQESVSPKPSTSTAAGIHPGYFTAQELERLRGEEGRGAAAAVGPAARAGDLEQGPAQQERGDEWKRQALDVSQQAPSLEGHAGGPEQVGHARPFAPFDHRSALFPEQANALLFKQEAKCFPPAPVAVIAPDRNLVLAQRTARGPKL